MSIELKLSGLSCGHCERAVTQALAAVPGVDKVLRVDRVAGVAEVEGEADPQALVEAIREEGYQAELPS